jgi:hypothetical protein
VVGSGLEKRVRVKPKQIFGIVVRSIGVLLLILGALYVLSGVVVLISPNFKPNLSPAWHYFFIGIVGISLYFLRGATHLVRFAYPGENSDDKADSD